MKAWITSHRVSREPSSSFASDGLTRRGRPAPGPPICFRPTKTRGSFSASAFGMPEDALRQQQAEALSEQRPDVFTDLADRKWIVGSMSRPPRQAAAGPSGCPSPPPWQRREREPTSGGNSNAGAEALWRGSPAGGRGGCCRQCWVQPRRYCSSYYGGFAAWAKLGCDPAVHSDAADPLRRRPYHPSQR